MRLLLAAAALALAAPKPALKTATFAGGCFWCMQPPYDSLPGVVSTRVGYCGGAEKDPTYEDVSYGRTGHAEAVEVVYDPARVSYETLLDVFWRQIDPTQRDRQFVDVGRQYRTAVFYHDAAQREAAEASRRALEKSGRFGAPIVTEIVRAGPFYPAEEHHQQYYRKSPKRYKFYRYNSGRDQFIQRVWGR